MRDGGDWARLTEVLARSAETKEALGGFYLIEVRDIDEAIEWAAKIAKACRCSQELREFHYDPES